ncbi:WXG100 family type VII secretion target [Streptomyces sp. NPDC005799]|uniref:WXG100 family type VII secretion target n=1 Tax=Streptomyces sp. NPDC005799 TaxID=3154678 RepID=UPI0033CF5EC2
MAHTFEELVNLQRAADEAHARVLSLRDEYGPSTQGGWSGEQADAYDESWRAWRTAAEVVQAAVTAHAKDAEKARHDVEGAVKKAARHPEPAES